MALAEAEQTLVCVDCEKSFVFSTAEQVFYAERGFRRPVRCPDCRAWRRAERNADVVRAHDGSASVVIWKEGFGNYGGTAVAASRARSARRTMRPRFGYPAICTACGRETEVPFNPRNRRPVFCRECFDQRRGR